MLATILNMLGGALSTTLHSKFHFKVIIDGNIPAYLRDVHIGDVQRTDDGAEFKLKITDMLDVVTRLWELTSAETIRISINAE